MTGLISNTSLLSTNRLHVYFQGPIHTVHLKHYTKKKNRADEPYVKVAQKQFPAHFKTSLLVDTTVVVSKNCPINSEHVLIIFMTQ